VRIPDLNGTSKSLRDFLGHPLIVNFWATWCEPCRREMPLLQQLQQRHQGEGLQVLGVAIDSRPAVQQYLRTRPVNYPILAGETEGTDAMSRFGAQPVLPFSVFTDAKGQIILLKAGELHPEEADYILSTEQAISAGKETIAQARTAIEAKLRELAIARAKASSNEGHQIR
jgi:thiol-disulfide isomerase/thioredoxin